MSSFQSELFLGVTVADLPAILEFVEEACRQACVDPNLLFDLQLAVEEACSNVIEHAYQGRGGELGLMIETRNGDVVVTVRDQGRPFDPRAIGRPDTASPLRKRPIGGLGLHLMYELMDDVRFSFEPGRNTLTMIKHNAIEGASLAPSPAEVDG